MLAISVKTRQTSEARQYCYHRVATFGRRVMTSYTQNKSECAPGFRLRFAHRLPSRLATSFMLLLVLRRRVRD